jgi:anaerobic selenocysteine-containing dehydrogenase
VTSPGEFATSVCPLDCPDTCTLSVEVTDGRVGRLDGVGRNAPTPANPFTDGWICAKVRRFGRRVHSPERVLTPLVRTGRRGDGEFRTATWDEAVELVAERLTRTLDEHGGAAVVPYLYNSSAGSNSEVRTERLFRALGTSHVAHTICAATAGAAWDATFPGMLSADPLDLASSQLVVVWGANPSVSNTHLTPLLDDVTRRGGAVVVVDPRRTPTADRAALHVPVRPGTDVALALAAVAELERTGRVDRAFCDRHADGVDALLEVARHWTPEVAARVCGVEVDEVRRFADLVADVRPGVLRLGWGLERNRHGGAAIRAAAALWVVAGQFGVAGSGVLASTSSGTAVGRVDPVDGPADTGTWARELNMVRLGRDLLEADPPVRFVFVQGANPVATAPDQHRVVAGLSREDLFVVVHDQVLTDTARLADLVLPATTHLEADVVAESYGSFSAGAAGAVVGPVGESRSNDELASALADRLGLDVGPPLGTQGLTGTVATRPEGTVQFGPEGHPASTAPAGGRARVALPEGPYRVPSPAELLGDLDDRWLTLLTPASPRTINSMLGELGEGDLRVTVHPDDAAAAGVADGDEVVVVNDLGEVRVRARVADSVRPGVCSIPKGTWIGHAAGATANALIPDDVDPTAGGACFNDARVRIVRSDG